MSAQVSTLKTEGSLVDRIPANRGDANRAVGVAEHLTPVLHNLIALAVNAKQVHWHVRGANFIGVHEFLDEVVAHAHDAADSVAERIVMMGVPVDARLGAVASDATTPALSAGFLQWRVAVSEMVDQLDAALRSVYTAIDELESIDPVSQDLVIAIAEQLDKDRWFLFSHYAE